MYYFDRFKKCFESISRDFIFKVVKESNCPENLCHLWRNLPEGINADMRWGDVVCENIPIENGGFQGSE